MLKGVTISPQALYFRTGVNNSNNSLISESEIILNRQALWNVAEEMEKKGFEIDTCKEYDATKINEYIKALNGIMPKDVKYEPKLDIQHKYEMFNKGDIVQVWDKTTDKNVFTINRHSFNEMV